MLAFAEWLESVGAAPSGRVVLYLDNCPDLLVAMFGTFCAGSAVVPANARLTDEELAFLVDDGEASVIVTDASHADVARRAAGDACRGGGRRRRVRRVIAPFDRRAGRPVSVAEVDPDETAWIFYTSGTTGRPKGAMLSHAVLNFVTVSWLADLTPLDEFDVTLHSAPLSHGAGFHALAAVARGAHQVIADSASFDPPAILELIRTHGITNTWLVPTQIVMLTDAAESPALTGGDLPTLQYVVYGGAPMTVAAMQRALERFGSIFVQLLRPGRDAR